MNKVTSVTTGIDNLHLTFSPAHSPEKIISTLFSGINFSDFRPVGKQQKWYKHSYYLSTNNGDILAAYHSESTSTFGKRNLLQIHGLLFSDSSLNALRPFDLPRLASGAVELDANVTEIDAYIDDCSGASPVHLIHDQSLPANYRDYISSSLIKDYKGEQVLPRPVGSTSIYYGRKGKKHNQVLFYEKHLCPNQDVYSPGNLLKYPWIRFELRLRGASARKHGRALLEKLDPIFFGGIGESKPAMGTLIAGIFKRYFSFVNPTTSRASRRPVQAWWRGLLSEASL